MQAILLAGGFGTRLRPVIGDTIPKPMAMFAGEPFLAHYIRSLAAQRITEVMLAVHHQAHVIMDYFQDRFAGIPIYYSVEHTPLGTGGAIKQALALLAPTSPVFVSNADSFMDLDIDAMRRAHYDSHALLTVALTEKPDCRSAGQARVNSDGRIIAFTYPGNKGAGLVSMGAYIVAPELFSAFDMPERFSFETDFKMRFVPLLKPCAYVHQGHFLDFGTAATFQQIKHYHVA